LDRDGHTERYDVGSPLVQATPDWRTGNVRGTDGYSLGDHEEADAFRSQGSTA